MCQGECWEQGGRGMKVVKNRQGAKFWESDSPKGNSHNNAGQVLLYVNKVLREHKRGNSNASWRNSGML